jgi:subtilisin family serine protease
MGEIRRIVVVRADATAVTAPRRGDPVSTRVMPAALRALTGAHTPDDRGGVLLGDAVRGAATVAVAMVFDDEDAVERLRRDRAADVVGVFSNPRIRPTAKVECGDAAVGTSKTVSRRFERVKLLASGLDGSGVDVAIVDTGIKSDPKKVAINNLTGGWHPTLPNYEPGTTPRERGANGTHGTMCAWNAQLLAPKASIYDYALLQSKEDTWTGFLSDAIDAFVSLIRHRERSKRPLVVNNSWAIYDPDSEDLPVGDPGNYSANPSHPFNVVVRQAIAGGADVVFAAGNCGSDCAAEGCRKCVGSGRSIHGAAGLADVLTVAGVSTNRSRLGYSSQGPSSITLAKPDLCAYAHFAGSGVYADDEGGDSGTSTAAPLVAGLVAALRTKAPSVSAAALASLLRRTATVMEEPGFDYDFGYGLIDPVAAAKALGIRLGRV